MAGNRKFHNKFHSANHHTIPSPHIIDSGLDPIASHDFPFIGDFVLNGTVSGSNNYLLNGMRARTFTLDSIRHGMHPTELGLPGNWNIFRDSTYIDGDAVITGNLSAIGELTYLHTQVYSTSANEIDVRANNSNGKSIGLRVDQYGTNDVLHVYNDAVSTLLITGSADQTITGEVKNSGGQLGVNLGSLDNIDRPNQRLTIVGSVSVVGDPYEYLDQNQQIDPGVTGSLYIEGGLHVNDKTYLDQVTIDTTDGKTYVSGAGDPGEENPVDIDVPILLDRTTIDTTDGNTYITGTNKVYIDTDGGLDVDTHTQLDQLTVDTTDGEMLIDGSNWLRVEVPADFNKHVNLDRTHINTDDGSFVVSGSNKMYIDTDGGLDVDTHTQLDQLTVDTTDGKMYVKGNNILDVESHAHFDQVTIDTTFGKTFISGNQIVDIESHTHLDQVTIDTDSGKTYISGTNILEVDTATELDQVTINTTDGKTLVTHDSNFYGDRLPLDVDVPTELTQTTVDTTSGDFSVIGSGNFKLAQDGKFIVESETELNKLTVDVTKGNFLIKGKESGNIFDVNVNTSFNDATLSAGDVHITTGVNKSMLVDGGGRVDYKTEVFFDNEVELDKTTIDTADGEFRVISTDWQQGLAPWHNVQEMNVGVPTRMQSLTASSNNEQIVIEGSNKTLFYTPVELHRPVLMTDTVDMTDQVRVNNLSVSGFTDLDETHIDTTDGDFIVSGSGDTNIKTYAVFDKSVYIKGNLRVDGNAWLSAGYDGKIYVGDTDGDNVIFHADIDSDMLPNANDIWRLGRPGKRWLDVNSFAGTFSEIFADNTLFVDGKTELDETEIITDDGSFVISGTNPTTFYTDVNIKSDLTLEGQLSATKGPWIFTGCELNPAYHSGSVNPVDQTDGSTDNVSLTNLPYHQFQVDCNSLFSRGLTANGPVQIGELPEGVTDELLEPTLEVLGNLHVREGNIKIVSDIRHLEDENTLIRFKPDAIEFRAGDAPLLTLTEKDAQPPAGRDIVEIGSQDSPADLKIYKQSETEPEAITFNSETGETRFDGNIGVNGDNEAAPVIGEGIDVHGSVRVTETLSAKNLIVDYITVQEDSFGNIGGSGTGGGSELAPVSGVATANATTTEYVEGENIVYEGVPVGITFDITEEQNTIQKLFSFTFEAQSADEDLGINIGDVQTTTYQFAAKWDEYWSEAFVNDVEYGIVHTSDNPFAEVTSVVLSATDVPTNERIVKIVVKPTVDIKYFSHNVLAQIKPKRLDTVTTADFDVNGDLSVFGQVSAAQGLTVDGDHLLKGEVTYLSAATFEDDVTFKKHVDMKELAIGDGGLYVKGDLRVDGNAYLSAGAGGVINVGDSTDDIINFTADVASDIIPNIDSRYTLGGDAARWQTLHTRNVSAVGLIDLDGRQIIRGVADQYYYKRPGSTFSDFTPAYFWPQVDINENIKTDQVLKLLSMSDQQVTVELENGTTQTLNVTEQYTDGADETYTVNESVFSGESFMGYDWTHASYYGSSWDQPMTIIETSPFQDTPRSGGLDLFVDGDNNLNLQTVYGTQGPYDNVNFVNIQHNTPFVLTSDQAQLDVNMYGQFTMSPQNVGSKTSLLLSIEIDGAIYSRHINDFGTTYSFDENITITPGDCNLLWDPQGNAPQYPNFASGKSVKFGFWFANGVSQLHRPYPETHDIHVSQLGFKLSVAVDNPSTPDLIPGTYVRGTAWELAERSEAWEALTVFGNSMLSGAATVQDNIHGQSDFRLDGNASLSGTLTVGDNTTLQKNLNVSGAAHFGETVTIEGRTQINNNVEITGTQDVSGTIHTADDLRVDGDTFLSGGLTVEQDTYLSGGLIVDEDTILNSDLHVKGDLRVDGNAYLSAGHDGIINVGDKNTDNVVFHADVDSNILPDDDVAFTLGSNDQRWLDLHVEDVSATGRGHFEGHSASLSALQYTGNIQHAGGSLSPASQVQGGTGQWDYQGNRVEEKYAYDGDPTTHTGNYRCWISGSKTWTTYTFPTPVAGNLKVHWQHKVNNGFGNIGSWIVYYRSKGGSWKTLRNLQNRSMGNDSWKTRIDQKNTGTEEVYQVRIWQDDIGKGSLVFRVNEISVEPTANTDLDNTPLHPGDTPILRWMLRDDNSNENNRLISHLQAVPATYQTNVSDVNGASTVLSFSALDTPKMAIVSDGLPEQEQVLIYGYGERDAEHGLPIYLQNFSNVHANSASIVIDKYFKPEPTLIVDGDSDLNGNVDIQENLVVHGDVLTIGNTTLSGTLDVDDETTLHSTLDVHGKTTLHDQLEVEKHVELNSTLNVDGHTTIDNNLLVTGTTKLSGHLEVDDDADIHGDVNTHGLTASGDLMVTGDIHGKENLKVDKHAQIDETMNVVGDAKFDSNVHIKGDLRVDGNAYLSAGASGSINVGDTETDIVIFNADIGSDVIPDVSDSFDLGKPGKTWNEVHWNGGNSLESNSVYDFVNSTSGEWGYANLSAYQDDTYVLRHDQVPPLAITHVRRVTNSSLVTTLKDLVYRGDIVLVADTEDNLVAIVDHPTGEYDKDIAEYSGYERLFAPGNMVRFINGHQGPSVTLDPDDLDDTDSTHKFVAQGEIDNLHSIWTSLTSTSGNWDSVYTTVGDSSAHWYEVYNNVAATSADRDSVYVSVNNTSADWNDARTTLNASSADWYDARTTLNASSGDWYDTRTSVMNTSGTWDSVYSFVNADSATNNTIYNQSTFVNASGDTITGDLNVNGKIHGNTAYFTSLTALSSYIDVVDIRVRELSGFDIIDGDLTVQGDISAIGDIYLDKNSLIFSDGERFNSQDSKNAKSVYNTVLTSSADWYDTRTTLNASSADWYDARTTLNASSADWYDARTTLNASSADWYDTRTSVMETSGDWNDARTTLNTSSADWYDARTTLNTSSADWYDTRSTVMATSGVYNTVNASSGHWYDARTTLGATSGDWNDTRSSVMNTSGTWDSVYSHVNNTSGYGYATVGADGLLEEHLVPNLSITETYVVTYDDSVADLCSGQLQGPVDIQRGDVVIITATEQNLIAVVDQPTGEYHQGFDTFDGFSKLQTPTDYIKTINGKQGLMVTLNPDDLDDEVTAHKFVDELQKYNWDSTFATVCAASADWNSVYTSVNETSGEWNSVYSFVNSDSATNNTDYNQTTFVNASGDTITGDLVVEGETTLEGETTVNGDAYLESTAYVSTLNVSAHTTLNTLNVSGATNINGASVIDDTLDVHGDTILYSNLHVKGDLRVDGNAFLSAGVDGNINVGDADTDNVVFRADVDSDFLADKKDVYTLGSEAKRWLATYSMSGLFDYVDIHDLDVTGVAKFTGKTDERGPGVIVRGTPTGIFDLDPYGFDDNGVPRADYMNPDVDIVGDVALHGSLSADNAHIFSLTASHFKAEYQKLMINDGDLEMLNGNIKQRGGNVLIESDLGHIDDENTYMRFQPDEISFYCHDVKMLQFQELTTGDDVITVGDAGDAVDLIVQNPTDTSTLYIDGDKAYIGIGTATPEEKLHVATGQAQFAAGDKGGAVMITSGTTDERVDKTGSIRWNSELGRYEGYREDTQSWVSFGGLGDSDGDTYIDVDAGSYPDSDRLALYTAGCSAMTIYPNQTVAFAGDIQFDNITIYDNDSVTGPLSATTEFIYLKVNGKDRAIRLWATPEDTREDIETFHGESVTHIGDECGLGHGGQIPTQTISAHPVLFNPPTQRIGLDTDGDGIVDYLDTDDDGDGIPDYMDIDHELTAGMNDSDGDGIADPYDTDRFENNNQWDGGGMPWQDILSTWNSLTGSNK